VDWIKCITSRLLRVARREAGLTLIETIFAIVIFGIVSTSVISVLTSATAADGLARQKTIADELAAQQVEYVRQLAYADVCLVSGNPTCPAGVIGIASSQTKWVMGLRYKLTSSIRWVNDKTPTGAATAANYKRVRITVYRVSDNKLLARVNTYVSNPSRTALGGIDNAVINVNVLDNGYLATPTAAATPVQGAQVDLWDGPSPHSSDTTDETGLVTFANLVPNPSDGSGNLLPTGATAYYDILAGLGGYQTLREELPPGTVPSGSGAGPVNAAHLQINPSQTQNTTIHLYRPATINVKVQDASGNPYTGTAYVDIGAQYPRCAQTFSYAYSSTSTTMTIVPPATIGSTETVLCPGGEQAVSGVKYTVGARSSDGTLVASAVSTWVPANYPTDLSSTFILQLQPTATKSCTVTVTKGGTPVKDARVDAVDGTRDTGNPQSYATGITDLNGKVTFTLPVTTAVPGPGDFDIKAWAIVSGSAVYGGLTDRSVPNNLPSSGLCNFAVAVS
jgi:type II secretory pathway pseudopilin PulG